MSFFSGGSRQRSESSNQAYPFLQQQLGGSVGNVGRAGDLISALLGGDRSALDSFANSAGLDFIMDQGSRAITGNRAAQGLLRSGGTGTALMDYGQDRARTFMQDYISNAMGLGQLGLGAAGTLASAGQRSTSTSRSKPGLGSLLGAGLSLVAKSDRRLKTNEVRVGTLKNGVPVYEFEYINEPGVVHTGVMAQDLLEVRPDLVILNEDGFYSVT